MDSTNSTRRRLLRLGATLGAVGLAGCLGGGNSESPTPTATATATDGDGQANTSPFPEATDTPGTRTVTFASRTGPEVTGTLYGSGDCGVALVPQIDLDRESWQPQARKLADAGLLALAIDETEDDRAASVLGAIDYLRAEQSVNRVVLVGASTSGEAVMVANADADDGAVDGVVTLSAAGGADRAAELQGRKLFVVSEGDEDRFVRGARELSERAPDPERLLTYQGSAHGQRLFESPHASDLRTSLSGLVASVCED